MSLHKDVVRLHHMLDHARAAGEIVDSCTRDDLLDDKVKSWALVHLFEIIGEAAAHISDEYRLKYPHIPWSQIIGLRNRLIHGYDAVDMTILWELSTGDLPNLIEALECIPELNQE